MKRTEYLGADIGKAVVEIMKNAKPSRVGISGGRSIVPVLERIGELSPLPEFFLVDERLEGEKNIDLLLGYIPKERILYSTEKDEMERIAKDADMLVMGVGEDCHIASIFPGREYSGLVDVIEDSPKPPPRRITITPQYLESFNGEVVLIFRGEAKRNALERFLAGECHPYVKNAVVVSDMVV